MPHRITSGRQSAVSRPLICGAGAILDAELHRVHRDRDFGRVEAHVTLIVKAAGAPARPVTVYTNVEARGGDLRRRLLRDAAGLADQMMTRQTGSTRAA